MLAGFRSTGLGDALTPLLGRLPDQPAEALPRYLRRLLAAQEPYEPDFARLRHLVLAHCREEETLFPAARQRRGELLERIGWLQAARRAELVAELGPPAS